MVVRHTGPHLVAGAGVLGQHPERFGQLLVEQLPVVRVLRHERVQVVGQSHGVHPPPERLGVFGLLEAELRQSNLVAQPALGGHRPQKRLDVLGDGFLTGRELRAQVRRRQPLSVGQLLPVPGVDTEVDVGRVPELAVALGEQSQRQGVPVQPSTTQGMKTSSMLDGAGHDGHPFFAWVADGPQRWVRARVVVRHGSSGTGWFVSTIDVSWADEAQLTGRSTSRRGCGPTFRGGASHAAQAPVAQAVTTGLIPRRCARWSADSVGGG